MSVSGSDVDWYYDLGGVDHPGSYDGKVVIPVTGTKKLNITIH